MAKQRFGINDGYRGTVGTVIGYQWRGQWCLRARPRSVRNPRTAAQQMNRTLFKEVVRYAATLKGTLRIGLHGKAVEAHMTECNLFAHINKECFALDGDGRLAVDYEGLEVSRGPLAPVGFGEPTMTDDCITVPFEKNPLHARAESDDEVFLFALCPALGASLLSSPAYRRSKSVSLLLPDEWQGHEVHLYGFVADHTCRASESVYLGCLTNEGASHDTRLQEKLYSIAPLVQEGQQDTGGDGTAHHAGDVGSHGVLEEVVGLVVLEADVVGDAGSIGHGTDT